MTYSELKTLFSGILNRRDITTSQIEQFITLGIQYVQRKLRVPPMEKTVEFTTDGTGELLVPGDFLELISLSVNDTNGTYKLERLDLQTVLREQERTGQPTCFHRKVTNFLIAPIPPADTIVSLDYYSDSSELSADSDHNWLTDAAPGVVVYAALRYAADYYLDDRKAMFKATLDEELADLQEMSNRDELVGASMSPLYPDQTGQL